MQSPIFWAIFLIGLQPISAAGLSFPLPVPIPTLMDIILDALKAARNETAMQKMCTSEQINHCIDEARTQAGECFDENFDGFAMALQISEPSALKQCIQNEGKLLDQYLPCVKESLRTPTSNGETKVPTIEFDKFFTKFNGAVDEAANLFTGLNPIPAVKTAVGGLILARKTLMKCFTFEKNSQGNCFARAGCMPNIPDDLAKKMYITCGMHIDWWKAFETTCNCAANAGIDALKGQCETLPGLIQGLLKQTP